MGRGISKQQREIITLLKERGENPRYGSKDYVWMSTREVVMSLYPEVEAYLAEKRRYARWVHRNMMNPLVHERYLEHIDKLNTMPNYHTVRTSVNRALRGLVKRGLIVRQPYWGMYQKQGVSTGWLLPEYITDYLKIDPEYAELIRNAYS